MFPVMELRRRELCRRLNRRRGSLNHGRLKLSVPAIDKHSRDSLGEISNLPGIDHARRPDKRCPQTNPHKITQ